MGIKNDVWIAANARLGMITPCAYEQVKRANKDMAKPCDMVNVISYGISSYGYDMRVANEYKIFTNLWPGIIDPKDSQNQQYHDVIADDYIVIPPNSFALARSVELFDIPRNVITICVGKSTYARCGVIVNVTCFEPEWRGHVTIEISNTTPLPSKIYSGEGIAQVLFFEADEECEISYKDKHGKYFGQTGITLPKV